MNLKNLLPAIAILGAATASSSQIVTYPAPAELVYNDDFSVRVRPEGSDRWFSVDVYPVKVDEVKGAKHNPRTASMAYFDMDSCRVEIEVTSHRGPITSARVRPLSYAIESSFVRGDSVMRFTIDRPRNLSVEVNGEIFSNLHLFANPKLNKDLRAAAARRKLPDNFIYFAPGIHRLDGDTLRIKSGQTVFIDGGARVIGQLIVDGERDVKILGRGEVHPQGRGEGAYVKRSRNVEVDGLIMTQCPVGQSDSVTITNVKVISSYGWGDGLNVFASDNVTYDGCFARNSDDCTTVYATRKGFDGGAKNITFRNCTLWADVAHPVMIGLHGNAEGCDTIQNIRFQNIDILDHSENQIDYQGCFAINVGDNNLVKDLLFEDVRVEDFRKGQLFNIRIFYNRKYCLAPGRGIENVTFRNISYNGDNANLSIIAGYDDDHKISGITFDNLRINGRLITDDMPGKPAWYKTSDFADMFIGEHVENVTFISTQNQDNNP